MAKLCWGELQKRLLSCCEAELAGAFLAIRLLQSDDRGDSRYL